MLEDLPFRQLPLRRTDAVCILTPGQDQWGVAFTPVLRPKQAWCAVRFHSADRTVPEAKLYLLPSLTGLNALSRRRENELWSRVRAGATAYVSLADGMLGRINEAAGVRVRTRSQRCGVSEVRLPGGAVARFETTTYYELDLDTAETLAAEEDGRPFLLKNRLGDGEVFLLLAPLEAEAAAMVQLFTDGGLPLWQFYRAFAGKALADRVLKKSNPLLGVTEHPSNDGGCIWVFVNYSRQPLEDTLTVNEGWQVSNVLSGHPAEAVSPGHYGLALPALGYAVWRGQLASS